MWVAIRKPDEMGEAVDASQVPEPVYGASYMRGDSGTFYYVFTSWNLKNTRWFKWVESSQ